MQIGLIFVGFLFFLNPDFVTFDPIPDLIGYLLITIGLSKLSYLDEDIKEAKRFSRYLIAVSAIKLFSSPVISFAAIQTTRLTGQFFFAVVELALTYFFVSELFRGINSLAVRLDGNVLLEDFETARIFAHVFFAAKIVLGILPQFVILFFSDVDSDPNEVPEYGFLKENYVMVRNVAYVIGAVLILAMGIYTARILRAYLRRAAADAPFVQRVCALYEERVTKNENARLRIAYSSFSALSFAAFCFLPSFYLDRINILPRPLFFLLFLIALSKAKELVFVPRGGKCIGYAGIFISLASYLYRLVCVFSLRDFALNFSHSYLGIFFAFSDEFLSLLAALWMLRILYRITKQRIEYAYGICFAALILAVGAICTLSFFSYTLVIASDLVPAVQWGVFLPALFVHKKALDEIHIQIKRRYI